ncbi:MAG TPA: glycosyltransferase [Solirubrobacterales bacterium]|nr:glycosyltransferase [Solirubrobacterales bacterium]
MRVLWPTVVVPLLDALRPSTIVEFGDDARFTAMLEAAAAVFEGSVEQRGDSLPGDLSAAELALIHGEPNWYSVTDRLDQLAAMSGNSDAPFPVTLVHGIDWPTGRRDAYPNPSAIPIDARQPHRGADGMERALDRHDLRNGVLTAVEDFLDRYEGDAVDAIHVPGLGGVAILVSQRRLKGKGSRPLAQLIAGWRLSPLVLEQIATIEGERVRTAEELNRLQAELDAARAGQAIQSAAAEDARRGQLEKLAARNAKLTEELARQEARAVALAGEAPSYEPASAPGLQLRDVNAPQPLGDPSQPLPLDRKGILLGVGAPAQNGAEPLHAIVSVGSEAERLRRCIWSLLARCDRPLRLTLVVGAEIDAHLHELIDALSVAEPLIQVTRDKPDDDISEWRLRVTEPVTFSHQAVQHLLTAAGEAAHPVGALAFETLGAPPWAGPDALALLLAGERRDQAGLLAAAPCTATRPGIVAAAPGAIALDAVVSGSRAGNETTVSAILDQLGDALGGERELRAALRLRLENPLAIAYVLPGLPEGGSGGTHSIFQEALALDSLGARVRVLVSQEFAGRAEGLYPEADGLVRPYSSAETLGAALEGFNVVIATEAPSTRLVAEHVGRNAGVVGAYYVQDYEPLFSPDRSPSADTALLSYRRAEGLLLFAKTNWIGNVVGSAHAVPVAKVSPSLDRSVFNASGRENERSLVRVAAMIRPRTPRRRAAETLSALTRLKNELGQRIECLAFGCSSEEFEALPGGEGVECLELLSREKVARLLRRCDLFLDLSSYQAFGRTGLEAMACGCVPLLPAVGGVAEYAVASWNALLVDTEDEDMVTAAAMSLIEDADRLERLRRNGLQTAESFSPVRAASSQYACFAARRAAIEPS